jgi:ATP-dependent HslUV protease ATP-binding subunit HslU
LIKQYKALLATEGVDAGPSPTTRIDALADVAVAVNGQRREHRRAPLQTVMEKLLEEVSFDAEDRSEPVTVDAAYVEKQLAGIARNTDLSRFVL